MIDFDDISNKYFKKELRIKNIGRYYPSEVGSCLRKAYYSFVNPKETGVELTKIFEAGNLVHDFVSKVLGSDKNPEIELIESETPFKLEIDDFIISGRIDNLILVKEEEKKVVIEVKSTKLLSMIDAPKEEHIMQLQIYLHAREIQDGALVYVEKNTLQSKSFPVKYDPALYALIVARFRKLHAHLKSSSLPKPEARLLEDKKWMCRYCDYRSECFQNTPEIGLYDVL